MYKNQLQELAQRSCFNLPSYACVREGPDHAPRFTAFVNFNGEIFQGPSHCTTLRQAEHAAAEVALTNLSSRAPSRSLAARVLDETGVYKNLLQETTHRAGLNLPVYTTVRSGPGHQPVFTSTVELAGMCISGEPAKTKKQAEKNAAMVAWSALKQMPDLESLSWSRDTSAGGGGGGGEEQEQVVRYLQNIKPKEENRHARQREHCQQQQQKPKKKLVGFNDGTSSISSPHRSVNFQQQWRSLDPFADFTSIHSSPQQQKKRSFLAPLHPTGRKLVSPLQFTSNSSASSQEPFSSSGTINSSIILPTARPVPSIAGNTSSQSRSQETQTLSDGKNPERLYEKAIQGKPSSSSVLSNSYADPNTLVHAGRAFSPPPIKISKGEDPQRTSSTIPVPKIMNTGGFHTHGIAPAVQIRSVIPVCSAPPTRQPQQSPVTNTLPSLVPNKETESAISGTIPKLNNLQL
ncbi:double-stranded RNA-binding protein 3-like [Phalaenopsis equestris]|uniref:double-stranded RNA-binding protein 3-like n=1 Tax=Phalaenopsis equestris TaxID=78828 RepID=UPI0009E65194|nr:double-stranded RNA-binding protein 3-like [Phalaenopsis equestris]